MGIINVRNKSRLYSVQLNTHAEERVELPIEKLHAIFIETTGTHGDNVKEVAMHLLDWGGATGEIIERAKASGTELWFGDVAEKPIERIVTTLLRGGPAAALAVGVFSQAIKKSRMTRRDILKLGTGAVTGISISGAPLFAGRNLAKPGDASNRTVSRAIAETYGKLDPMVFVRNAIIVDKVKALAEKTGHTKIGIRLGSLHAGITNLLEADRVLSREQRSKIAARGSNALKMFRCKYDKEAAEWQVQEHSL